MDPDRRRRCVRGASLTSPGIAALHHDKPVTYHDPLGIVRFHSQPYLSALMTHSLDELLDRLRKIAAAARVDGDALRGMPVRG